MPEHGGGAGADAGIRDPGRPWFAQATIIGVGLIGGSLGLALREHKLVGKVVGFDTSEVLVKALQCGAIDAGDATVAGACRGSDLIVLAAPVSAIRDLLPQVAAAASPLALITDTGSTKREIIATAKVVFGEDADVRFLGGHPMAGKELSGVERADADLFSNAVWILTPVDGTELQHAPARRFQRLLEKIARPIVLEASEHDRICAWVSHLPQLLSTALANAIQKEFGNSERLHGIGGRALREMTRIAASPFSMWGDIFATNADNLDAALRQMECTLGAMRAQLADGKLEQDFVKANGFRLPAS